ncbi:MAG: hypothetical protein ACRDMZ_07745 [Solirubrobacteraceae bacterium]
MLTTISRKAALTAVLALGALSAPALAVGPPAGTPSAGSNPGTAHKPTTTPANPAAPTTTPGPSASPSAKGKAYGRYCADQSKKRVAGENGTAFSRCVTAMAKLATGATSSPRAACKTASKKHVKGEKGTPYSRCVSAAAKLKRDQRADEAPAPAS